MKKVTIIGAGALGSHLVQFLREEPIQLRVIDFDRVESKNTRSQFHGKPHNGKMKTESLKLTMKLLWGYDLQTNPNKLTQDNVDVILNGVDLIIDCVDNGATRRLIQTFAKANKIPCLHGGLDANGSFGRICWTENFTVDDEPGAGAATCENGQFLPFITITAAYLARSVQLFLNQEKKVGWSITPSSVILT